MPRLVEADRTPTWKLNPRDRSPSSFFDIRALDALLEKIIYLGSEVVAHEIELVATFFLRRPRWPDRWPVN